MGLLVIDVLQGGSHEGEGHIEKQRCLEAETTWPNGGAHQREKVVPGHSQPLMVFWY